MVRSNKSLFYQSYRDLSIYSHIWFGLVMAKRHSQQVLSHVGAKGDRAHALFVSFVETHLT